MGNMLPFNRIRELRNEKHWTQQELADAVGTNKKTIREYEIGKWKKTQNGEEKFPVDIPQSALIRLADTFGCSIDYLLCRSDCRTVDNAMIGRKTGLSDDAINKLRLLRDYRNNLPVATVNQLLKTVVPVPPAFNGIPVKGVDDGLQLIGLYLSGGDLQADDMPIKTGLGYAVTLDGDLLASGGILNLINLRLTEYRAGITKRKKKKGSKQA